MPGNGVQEIIDVLESGQPLPSDPEYEGLTVESSGDFIARIEKLKHAYEAQFLDRRDWKVCRLYSARPFFKYLQKRKCSRLDFGPCTCPYSAVGSGRVAKVSALSTKQLHRKATF